MTAEVLERVREFDAAEVGRWLIHEAGGLADIDDLVEGLATTLDRAGLALDRLTLGIPILLPHISGMQIRWYRGEPIQRRELPATMDTLRKMEVSPIQLAYQEGRASRCPIGRERRSGEYPIIEDLRGEGFTDYAVLAVPFSDGTYKALTVATRAPDGFEDRHVDALAALMPTLAPVLEVRALRHLARSLLNVYVGATAGGRVLDGEIRRGEGAMIQAVIWFCDLRGSTDLSIALDAPDHIALLNDFFGAVTGAVGQHGGEVLKFIGDAVLAIFPCRDMTGEACGAPCQAEMAASDALARIGAINRRAAGEDRQAIDIGIALHIGHVFFGNVGGEDRLDFTVIGPAVNLAARIQSVSAETGENLLVSEDFARASRDDYRPIGAFSFKGIHGWQMVYAPGTPEASIAQEAEAALAG